MTDLINFRKQCFMRLCSSYTVFTNNISQIATIWLSETQHKSIPNTESAFMYPSQWLALSAGFWLTVNYFSPLKPDTSRTICCFYLPTFISQCNFIVDFRKTLFNRLKNFTHSKAAWVTELVEHEHICGACSVNRSEIIIGFGYFWISWCAFDLFHSKWGF